MTRRLLLALLATLALAGGCGLSADDGPQAIAPENLPPDLLDPNPSSSTTLSESATTTSVTVYFLETVGDTERLTAAEREVKDPTLPADRLNALFSQQPDENEASDGLVTSIPADTVLLTAPRVEGSDQVVINLSPELFSIQGPELAKAFAQIVWSVTEVDGIRRVRFLVDGQARNALDADGAEKDGAVTRGDYRALAPG